MEGRKTGKESKEEMKQNNEQLKLIPSERKKESIRSHKTGSFGE